MLLFYRLISSWIIEKRTQLCLSIEISHQKSLKLLNNSFRSRIFELPFKFSIVWCSLAFLNLITFNLLWSQRSWDSLIVASWIEMDCDFVRDPLRYVTFELFFVLKLMKKSINRAPNHLAKDFCVTIRNRKCLHQRLVFTVHWFQLASLLCHRCRSRCRFSFFKALPNCQIIFLFSLGYLVLLMPIRCHHSSRENCKKNLDWTESKRDTLSAKFLIWRHPSLIAWLVEIKSKSC